MVRRGPYCYDYPRPMVTVDVALFGLAENRFSLLLVRRKNPPFAGRWALPGGFVEMDETLEASARRELREETGVAVSRLNQFRTFGAPGRDPRGRAISVAFLAVVPRDEEAVKAGDDAAHAEWVPLSGVRMLAFDHEGIVKYAVNALRDAATKPDQWDRISNGVGPEQAMAALDG